MKRENINLEQLFTDNICTFEMAKKAAAAGMTCDNTFFAYDKDGSINDGGWLQKVTGATFYPAINLAMAIAMLDDCEIQASKLACYRYNNKYFLKEGDSIISQQENLVDLFVATWIKYKKPDTGLSAPEPAPAPPAPPFPFTPPETVN